MEPLAESPSVMKMDELVARVGIVYAAVPELLVAETGLLDLLLKVLLQAGDGFPLLFRGLYLLQHDLQHDRGGLGMLVEVVVQLLLHEIAYE